MTLTPATIIEPFRVRVVAPLPITMAPSVCSRVDRRHRATSERTCGLARAAGAADADALHARG